jgi:hypothetical protein
VFQANFIALKQFFFNYYICVGPVQKIMQNKHLQPIILGIQHKLLKFSVNLVKEK